MFSGRFRNTGLHLRTTITPSYPIETACSKEILSHDNNSLLLFMIKSNQIKSNQIVYFTHCRLPAHKRITLTNFTYE